MNVLPDGPRTYMECKYCPGMQPDPKHIFSCPSVVPALFTIDFDSNMDTLHADKAEDIAKTDELEIEVLDLQNAIAPRPIVSELDGIIRSERHLLEWRFSRETGIHNSKPSLDKLGFPRKKIRKPLDMP
ncbi:hypothetical protein TNCV_712361 [Trichonephila clavipes]|nr:hypothetical protein TNCV_712361 [Trichonephila clavipes]